MSEPEIRRDGDTWFLNWDAEGVGMGLDRLAERRDELRAEITVESMVAGRVVGPVSVNLLSSQTQASFAKNCATRVNGLSPDRWHAIVVQACAIVAKQFRAPTPTYDLSEEPDYGPISYVVPGLVPSEETTVIYGDGEGAKSLLALHIAFCVTTGRELAWGDRPTQGSVLYLDWETNRRTVGTRLRRIALGELADVPRVHYRQCFRSISDELPSIREECSKKNISMVIVDSIGFAASGALVEDETARTAMNALRQLSPVTRLVVAHVSKEAAANSTGAVKPFGSAFFWNGMRSGIEVRRSEDQPNQDIIDLALFHRKANDGEHHKPIAVQISFDGRDKGIGFFKGELNETPDLAARTSLSSRLRTILRGADSTLSDMAFDTDTKEDTVYRTLKRMPDVVMLDGGRGRGRSSTWSLSDGNKSDAALP